MPTADRVMRLVAVVGLGLSAVACGGKPEAQGTNGKYSASLAYSRCMRSHGVRSFPDPKEIGGSIQVSGSAPGIDPKSPVFVSAQQSCRHLFPGGRRPAEARQQQALARLLRTSRCMRAHGVARFPDPTLSPPTSRADYSATLSNGVAWLAIPNAVDTHSPAFKRAATVCNLQLS